MELSALRRKLIHPLWLTCLVVMAVNDHFLKTADLLPGWLTGKLSDVTGLVVAPLLLALLFRVRSRRALVACHVVIGAVFAAINLNAVVAGWFEVVTAFGPQRWTVVVDPTDLLALPMLFISWRLLTGPQPPPAPRRVPRVASRALFAVAMLFCAANQPNPNPEPCWNCPQPNWNPDVVTPDGQSFVAGFHIATYVIGNLTSDKIVVRVRSLRAKVDFDCKAVAKKPATILSRKVFDPAKAWIVEPNHVLPFDSGHSGASSNCRVYLIDASGLPPRVVVIDGGVVNKVQVAANASTAGDRVIRIAIDSDGQAAWQKHEALSAAPQTLDILPQGACKRPPADTALAWTKPPGSTQVITEVAESPDGCIAVSFAKADTWFACLPPGSFPYKAGEKIGFFNFGQGHNFLPMDGWRVISDGKFEQLYFGTGSDVVPVADAKFKIGLKSGCGGGHDPCGGYARPMQVELQHAGLPDAVTTLKAGTSATFDQGKRTLHLLFSEDRVTADPDCGEWGIGPYHQSVYVYRP